MCYFAIGKTKRSGIVAALNVQIEVPNMGIYEMEILKHKLTVYAKKLIAATKQKDTMVAEKQYRHESLAGIFTDEYSSDDLRNEYLKERIQEKGT